MTKLEELIYSLATVLIRYHDTQGVKKLVAETEPVILRKKSRDFALGIIQRQEIKFDILLKGLIDACTKGYPDRLHFLAYILHEVIFLKEQLDRKNSFKPTELEDYQKQVIQLLKDLTQLLNTPKDKTHKVSYSALNSESTTCIALSGLINNAYFGNIFCNSGLLLIEEVLDRFHMTRSSTDEEIKEIAISICIENQNALLVSELQHQGVTQEIRKSEPDPERLALDARILELETQKSALEAQVLELSAANRTQMLAVSEVQAQILELSETHQAQQKTIAELRTELEITQTRLDGKQLELEQKQKELEEAQAQQPKGMLSYPFGLSALGLFNTRKLFFSQPQLTPQSPHQDDDLSSYDHAM